MALITVHGPVVDVMDHTMVRQFTMAFPMGYVLID